MLQWESSFCTFCKVLIQTMSEKLPIIILTGASGLVGRHLIEHLKMKYVVWALARRTQAEVGISPHKNIHWVLVDIANKIHLEDVMWKIQNSGDVEFIIHLAAYYNFDNDPHLEYERTNILGTELLLSQALNFPNLKRFIFASSVAACEFPHKGNVVNEDTLPNADFPYAQTKAIGESRIKEASQSFPCSIVRFAAVFTDWCEYGPLYIFLKTWLSKKWNSRILGGQGLSAVPYIHINCLNHLLFSILQKTNILPDYDIYIASPDGAVTHKELYDLSTRFFYSISPPPKYMPIFLSRIGVTLRDWLGRLIGNRPFERPWMIDYIDKSLTVNSEKTRKTLGWSPHPRYSIQRRLLYLIEHMKSFPTEWDHKNVLAMEKYKIIRPNLIVAEAMQDLQDTFTTHILSTILEPKNEFKYPNYCQMDSDTLEWYTNIYINLLIGCVRTGDRMSMVNYTRFLAGIRSREHFPPEEVCAALEAIESVIITQLHARKELGSFHMIIHDTITLTIQMAMDEVLDSYERIQK